MANTAWSPLGRPYHLLRLPEGIAIFSVHAKEQNLLLGMGMVMPQLCQALQKGIAQPGLAFGSFPM